MTLLALVLAIAAVTYASRAVSLVALPPATGRLADIVERLPGPLFAGLAVLIILDPGGQPQAPVIAAVLAATLAAMRRSLALVLVAGLGAYAVANLFTG